MRDRLFAHPKVEVIWDHVVEDILGGGDPPAVSGVSLKHVKTGSLGELAVAGVFVAIGHDPTTQLFRGQLDMDGGGYILTASDSTATGVPGVFAAGDVQDKVYRQAVTAAGTGCMAAVEAEKYLAASATGRAAAAE